jgi:hypothetical protein
VKLNRVRTIIILFSVVLSPANAFAALPVDRNAGINDTVWYDPTAAALCSAAGTGAPGGTVGTIGGTGNPQKVWNWLRSQGLGPMQAAGLMGNMNTESGFSPTRQQDSVPFPGLAWGLAQWQDNRRAKLAAIIQAQPDVSQYYAAQYGGHLDPATGLPPGVPLAANDKLILIELNYLLQESKARSVGPLALQNGFSGGNEWATLGAQPSIEKATFFWNYSFEVSGDSAAAITANRVSKAIEFYNLFSGSTATAADAGVTADSSCAGGSSTATSASCIQADAATQALCNTIVAYAWPNYRGSGYMTLKPEYAQAITQAPTNRYVGGPPPGVDCGGFVTTAMIGSGFAPTYNAGNGNTIAQEVWAKANWQFLGAASTINPADLHPGDVAISDHHTFMWVGTIPGFGGKIASASQTDRSPMADSSQSPTESGFNWYRKK